MKDNITDWALNNYRDTYKDDTITKEDIFYYTYGILHSNGYRTKYQANLVRGIPHIPMAPDFWSFCTAGRQLAELHLNFDTGPQYDLGKPLKAIPNAPKKIRFGRKPNPDDGGSKTIVDNTVLYLDDILVFDNIPDMSYKVNGRTPIQWFVDRYSFQKHSTSGITNYPLEGVKGKDVQNIIERLIYVGIQSDKVIADLPKEFEMDTISDKPKFKSIRDHIDEAAPPT